MIRKVAKQIGSVELEFLNWLDNDFIADYYLQAIDYYNNPHADLPIDLDELKGLDRRDIIQAIASAEAWAVYRGIRAIYMEKLIKEEEFWQFVDQDIISLVDAGIIGVNYELRNYEVEIKAWSKRTREFDRYIKQEWGWEEVDVEGRNSILEWVIENITEAIKKWERDFCQWIEEQPTLGWLMDRGAFQEELKNNHVHAIESW